MILRLILSIDSVWRGILNMSAPMTRCECHEVSFKRVGRYAERNPIQDFEMVMKEVGCGQTCTACHCDLKAYLESRTCSSGVLAESLPALSSV